jgi:hypothetical protein
MSFVYTPARKICRNASAKRVLAKVDRNSNWRGHLPLAYMLEWRRFIHSLKDHKPYMKESK